MCECVVVILYVYVRKCSTWHFSYLLLYGLCSSNREIDLQHILLGGGGKRRPHRER